MRIGIEVRTSSIGLQIFDSLYASRQNLYPNNNYISDIEIKETIDGSEDHKILFDYRPESLETINFDQYNLVLFCNGSESLDVITSAMVEAVTKHKNAYIVSDSWLDITHPLYDRVIWFCHNIPLCRDYWCRPFYPQFFDLKNRKIKHTKNIKVINGENKSWRNHALQLIKQHIPDVPIRSSISTIVHKTKTAGYESPEDTRFREYVNEIYPIEETNHHGWYYKNMPRIGIDEKFGLIAPGYFFLDEFFEYRMIVYPSLSWLNNELSITEKELKCFMAGTLPMPLGGANVNKLLNQLGFYTGWNLLPESLQKFDTELDHDQRYQQFVQAVAWINNNPQVLQDSKYQQLVDHNRVHFVAGNNGSDIARLTRILDL